MSSLWVVPLSLAIHQRNYFHRSLMVSNLVLFAFYHLPARNISCSILLRRKIIVGTWYLLTAVNQKSSITKGPVMFHHECQNYDHMHIHVHVLSSELQSLKCGKIFSEVCSHLGRPSYSLPLQNSLNPLIVHFCARDKQAYFFRF